MSALPACRPVSRPRFRLSLGRLSLAGLALVALTGCGGNDLAEQPVPLGDFVLGLNIAVADNVEKVPISREASIEEWEAAVQQAVDARFGRYEGARVYNIGVGVNAYALAPPGIPVVAAPKSVLVVTANIWDDATGTKLNPEGKRLLVFEEFSAENVVGTGLTRSKARQIEVLSYNAAKAIEDWLVANPQWFQNPPVPGDRTEGEGDPLLTAAPAGASATAPAPDPAASAITTTPVPAAPATPAAASTSGAAEPAAGPAGPLRPQPRPAPAN
jgi:hypothetical protein